MYASASTMRPARMALSRRRTSVFPISSRVTSRAFRSKNGRGRGSRGIVLVSGSGMPSPTALNSSGADFEFFPDGIDARFYFRGHFEWFWPGPRKTFIGPFAGGINTHLRPVLRKSGGVIQHVDRSHHELNITLRVDVIEHL